jgi:hypothetical protein
MIQIDKIEGVTYYLLIGGLILDHLTTFVGINYYNLYETNFIARVLMDLGLWSYTDLFICISLILVLRITLQKYENLKIILVFPLISGIIRTLVGISNLLLLT